MAARAPVSVAFSGLDETTIFRGSKVTKDYFRIFGIGAALGRTFVSAECNPGSDKVAILSHSVWNSQFGADPNVIGRAITLDGEPRVVIGVLQEAAAFDKRFSDIWCPLAVAPENRTRNYHWLWAAAKLKEGVTIEHARTQMSSIGARLSHDFPDTNRDWDVTVATLETEFVGSNRSTVSLKLPVGWGVMCGQLRGKRTSLRVRYAEYLLDWCKTPAYLPDRLRRTNSTMHA